jgi:hypothetical protein
MIPLSGRSNLAGRSHYMLLFLLLYYYICVYLLQFGVPDILVNNAASFYFQDFIERYTTNKELVRIHYKCLVPIYVFPAMKQLFPKQNYNVLS